MDDIEYKRLTRSCRRNIIGSSGSLWLGKDHVLCVQSTGYSESYKRYYFRDIQAFITRKTNANVVWVIIWGVLAAFCILIGLAHRVDNGALPIFLTLSVPFLAAALLSLTLGPTCSCQVRTAVQTEYLPLIRLRKAHKFFDAIRPLIAEAQGRLAAEEIPARLREREAMYSSPAPAATPVFQAPVAAENVMGDPDIPPRIAS
jgi:hypothetical protein